MMMFRLALRSLLAHPVRSGVLAGGFGLGVSVMASLLGVGDVMLEQARSPALAGGGDLVIAGDFGEVQSARYILSGVMSAPPLQGRARAVSPSLRSLVYLMPRDEDEDPVAVEVRGGIPSLGRALGNEETAGVAVWTDTAVDREWVSPDHDDVVRAMDRFHAIPDAPEWADGWAEWLYFNGQAGQARFYLTFLIGPMRGEGRRAAGVRLQLDDGGRFRSYSESAEVDAVAVLSGAPDLTIGRSQVRLVDGRYLISLDFPPADVVSGSDTTADASGVTGEIALEASLGRSLPPLTIRGARGWTSGYTVPVMSGALSGRLTVGGAELSLDGGSGYHDHNWGALDRCVVAMGAGPWGGPVVRLRSGLPTGRRGGPGAHSRILDGHRRGRSDRLRHTVVDRGGRRSGDRCAAAGRGRVAGVHGRAPPRGRHRGRCDDPHGSRGLRGGAGLDFYQLRARFHVVGRVGDRTIDLTAPGSAETFRGR